MSTWHTRIILSGTVLIATHLDPTSIWWYVLLQYGITAIHTVLLNMVVMSMLFS